MSTQERGVNMEGVLDLYSESKGERERKELTERAIIIYRSYREKFIELPGRALEVQSSLEERGLKPRFPIKAFGNYHAYLELFEFESEEAVRKFFETGEFPRLKWIITETEDALHSWAYNTLKNWVAESLYLIKRHDEKKRREEAIKAHKKMQAKIPPNWT